MTDSAGNRVALLTPQGRGAVACLAIEGPQAATILQRHVRRANSQDSPLETWPVERIFYCRWSSAEEDVGGQGWTETAAADRLSTTGGSLRSTPAPLRPAEDIILVHRASCRWEIHCHGGTAAARRIIADLEQFGCVSMPWREWIAEQETDVVRAAALALLTDAPTGRTAAILLDQYLGAWDDSLAAIREDLLAKNAEEAAARINSLLSFAALGRHLVEPWRVALTGPPNVGKSSLMNALAGYRRAIVHDQPGTTRDKLTVSVALDGWSIELIDTAGLHASGDPLEMAGVARAEAELVAADAVVVVFDVSTPWNAALEKLSARRSDAILVHNKSDLLPADAPDGSALAGRPDGLLTSAATGAGLDELIQRVVARLVPVSLPAGAAVPITAAQVEQLQAALEHAGRRQWEAALDVLVVKC